MNLRHRLWLIPLITATCVRAATFTVTTTNISGPGSLPVAIAQANATPGKNLIQFNLTSAITLGLQLPTITNSVAIMGRTDVPTVISGGGSLPLFIFAAGTTNSLSRLVLVNGSTTGNGAAINNSSTLHVDSCVITNHRAMSGSGGAIMNSGIMTVSSSVMSGNQAGTGGAVYNTSTMTVSDAQLSSNQAGNGGAIYNAGSLLVRRLAIQNNIANLGFGGGLHNSGVLSVSYSTFWRNQALGATGGTGNFNLHGIAGGGGAGIGGGMFSASGSASLTNCTFFANSASGGAGGGVINGGDASGNGGGNNGGSAGGSISTPVWGGGTITRGGTGGNGGFGGGGGAGGAYGDYGGKGGTGGFAGGGGGGGGLGSFIGEAGQGVSTGGIGYGGFGGGNGGMGNYPFTGGGGGGGGGLGAALFVQTGDLQLVNCTIKSNSASGGVGGSPWNLSEGTVGASGEGIGGGAFNYSGTFTLLNTIVEGNSASDNSPDLSGTFLSSGYNLIGNNQGATGLTIFDFQNVAANLGPLQDNGGPTLTCLPLQGSLAIGNGTSAGAPRTDQRGVPRPQGAAVDIGAVQTVTAAPLYIGPSMSSAFGFSVSIIFDSTNAYRVQGATNLTGWTNLTNYASGGSQHFLDASATNFNRRFYRAVAP